MYYMRIQRYKGRDIEFFGTLGECIKEVVQFVRDIEPNNYRGHFLLKQK